MDSKKKCGLGSLFRSIRSTTFMIAGSSGWGTKGNAQSKRHSRSAAAIVEIRISSVNTSLDRTICCVRAPSRALPADFVSEESNAYQSLHQMLCSTRRFGLRSRHVLGKPTEPAIQKLRVRLHNCPSIQLMKPGM